MQQPDLAGFAAPASSIHRLFFALWPGDELRQGIGEATSQLLQQHDAGGRRIGPHRYHLTLQFLGDYAELPPSLVEQARAAAASVKLAPFELVIDRAGSFRNRSIPWWLGCETRPEGLRQLWDSLGVALARAGVRVRSDKALVPHVTILRDARQPLPVTPIPPLDWPVDSFVLIHSELGARNAYTEVGRWPLR
ncbi:RNA 2',3'-cyclic phosphodiesterase [Novilysobacter erysipheiresistens]|uniref:RNA 2',3'-cyclic phosphodiesterase n=1 Tax=Novilysobacter erysipheiresistens TaxID=1749332 RepID=A0ABU7Z0T8_9GAMM